jgi:DNA repair exonuclease SbcCD nuclease subunit
MSKFIHTADWQLGMTRHFLEGDAQPRYTQARFDVVRRIGELAVQEECDFVIVSGDVFESNFLDRQTVIRSLDAMGTISVPVFLLPGNHDPLNASSIYLTTTFCENCPPHVRVLDNDEPVLVEGLNVQIVGAPWDSKEPLDDLVGRACRKLNPDPGVVRVVVGHGAVDHVMPDFGSSSVIHASDVEEHLLTGLVQYVGLGDRHSTTEIGSTGRFWYSGSPLVTDYDEIKPNQVLVVEVDRESIRVTPCDVGDWQFERRQFELNNDEDVDALTEWFEAFPDKQRTVVKLDLQGSLSIATYSRLEAMLDHNVQLFAAIEQSDRTYDLHVMPDGDDLGAINVSGFARQALEELLGTGNDDSADAAEARDALGLLFRLSRGVR